jgi:hypothetical protein
MLYAILRDDLEKYFEIKTASGSPINIRTLMRDCNCVITKGDLVDDILDNYLDYSASPKARKGWTAYLIEQLRKRGLKNVKLQPYVLCLNFPEVGKRPETSFLIHFNCRSVHDGMRVIMKWFDMDFSDCCSALFYQDNRIEVPSDYIANDAATTDIINQKNSRDNNIVYKNTVTKEMIKEIVKEHKSQNIKRVSSRVEENLSSQESNDGSSLESVEIVGDSDSDSDSLSTDAPMNQKKVRGTLLKAEKAEKAKKSEMPKTSGKAKKSQVSKPSEKVKASKASHKASVNTPGKEKSKKESTVSRKEQSKTKK